MVPDKTFKAPGNGTIRIVDAAGNTLHEHKVEAGTSGACQVKDARFRTGSSWP